MYGIPYLRVFDYVSESYCATGPVKESEVYPERSEMEKVTNAHITLIRLLSDDSSPLVVINTADTRGREEIHSRGGRCVLLCFIGDRSARTNSPSKKNPKKEKIQKPIGDF